MTALHIPASPGPRVADRGVLLKVRDVRIGSAAGGTNAPVLDDVNFDLRQGERLGVVGEPGAGLSTLAAVLTGRIESPDRIIGGTLELTGRPRRGLMEHAAGPHPVSEIGLVVPDTAAGTDPSRHTGGGGAVAVPEGVRVLIVPPAAVRQALLLRLCALSDERGIALIVLSRDLRSLAGLCDTLQVMAGGRIVERGPAAELFAHPRHRLTLALRDAAPDAGSGAGVRRGGCPFEPRCPVGEGRPECRDRFPEPRGFRSPSGLVTVKCHVPAGTPAHHC